MLRHLLRFAILSPVLFAAALAQVDELEHLRYGFEHPPPECRIMMRWWWFGPAVSKPELERELRAMKDAGIGGVELQPVYPLVLEDPERGLHNADYLSDEFLEDLRFAAETAHDLGLRFDITLGSGWPFGGPHIPITEAAGKLRIVSQTVGAGEQSVPVPNIGGGEKLLAAFLAEGNQRGAAKILGADEIADGRLRVAPSSEERIATFYIS
ncbi:MAG: glycoside hydrolase, partial [Acidobacteria bacterium]|nr:glycoside hydrolase [Acidobacteriota bacterium]